MTIENPVLEYHRGTSADHLDRFEGQWQKLWDHKMSVKSGFGKVALFTTCSHAKPYGKSWIHMQLRKMLWEHELLEYVDIIHVSSAGLIPSEYGEHYPFCAYDWNDAVATTQERAAYMARAEMRLHHWLPHLIPSYYKSAVTYFNESDDNNPVFQALVSDRKPSGLEVDRLSFVLGKELPPIQWALAPDVDDCLVANDNTKLLRQAIRTSIHRWS